MADDRVMIFSWRYEFNHVKQTLDMTTTLNRKYDKRNAWY